MRLVFLALALFLAFAAFSLLLPPAAPRALQPSGQTLSNIDAVAIVDTYASLKAAIPSIPPEYAGTLEGDVRRLEGLAEKYGITLPPVYAGVVSVGAALDDVVGTARRYLPRVEHRDVKLTLCMVQRHALRFLLEEYRKSGYVPRSLPPEAWRAYIEEEG